MTWLVDADVKEPLIPTGVVASGGTESDVNIGGQLYRVHEFTSSGTFTVSTSGEVEVFAVGGGGAGGFIQLLRTPIEYYIATGGGGGGGIIGCALSLSAGSHSVQVGSGASPTTSGNQRGGDSKLSIGGNDLVVALGGGNAAGITVSDKGQSGISAGFGGGSSGGGTTALIDISPLPVPISVTPTLAPPTIGQGNIGGERFREFVPVFLGFASGGGGGGSSSSGKQAASSTPANGGNGVTTFIKGFPQTFGAGGGGGSYGVPRAFGGVTGAGDGASDGISATSGQANTGGGGGGAVAAHTITDSLTAGSGGSGIVIIRYPLEG